MNRLCLAALLLIGCIRAPEIVMVDRATALELQAAGSFEDVERKVARSATVPRPVPLTPDQLEALGIRPTPPADETDLTDADRIDALLKLHCVGEGRDGLLADTHAACRGAADRASSILLIDRVNRARTQLWRWMQSERREASPEPVRRGWWRVHAAGVVCGAWIQREDGQWEEKKC